MDPFTILIGILLGAGAAAIIYVAFLAISAVRKYLVRKKAEKNIHTNAYIIKKKLASGDYRVVTGFFEGGSLKEERVWEAEDVDEELDSLKDEELVVCPT